MAFLLILGTPNYINEINEIGLIEMTRTEVKKIITSPLSLFDKAISVVFAQEGIYSNDSIDKGGETKYGISKTSYPKEDITNLTMDRAKEIYKRDFWDKYQYNKISNESLSITFFSTCVNVGPKNCHKILQKTLNNIIRENKLTLPLLSEDGILGNMSIEYTNRLSCYQLKEEYLKALSNYYISISLSNPSQSKYLKGWLNRVFDYLYI